MNKGWLELESDPGLFTLLLEDFGVDGVQVEEIYDLQSPINGPVYGFIFLFRWSEERRSRRKTNTEVDSFVTDVEIVNHIFFAQQIIPNSCATHALLSVLLNCDNKVKLGKTLELIKEFTHLMSPEDKGYAIANMPQLAHVHNSFARPEPRQLPEKQSGLSSVRATESETFHFVSYVPIGGHLFELDGLKPYPIDHGPWEKGEDWTEKFRRVISDRLGMATGGEPYHDIRFNLMTVVPDKRQMMEQKLSTLKTNRNIVLEALQQLLEKKVVMNDSSSDKSDADSIKGKIKEATKKNVTFSSTAPISCSSGMSSPSSSQQSNSSNSSTIPASSSTSASPSSSFSITALPTSSSPLKLKIISPQPSSILKSNISVTTLTSPLSHPESSTSASSSQTTPSQSSLVSTEKKSAAESDVSSSSEKGTHPSGVSVADNSSPKDSPETLSKPENIKQESNSDISSTEKSEREDSLGPSDNKVKKESVECSEMTAETTERKGDVGSLIKNEEDSVSLDSDTTMKEEALDEEKDVTRPLSIETKFMGLPSAPSSESTDTASEVGSSFSSPGSFANSSCQSSPHFSDGNTTSDGKSEKPDEKPSQSHSESRRKRRASHTFTPHDLVDLLKNVENEIESCQQILREENEKRKKYKIDACRRTHNYDQFIVTFLSMLAEQGHLGTLMEQNMSIKKPPSSTASVGGKISKKSLLKVSNKKSKGKLKKKGKK